MSKHKADASVALACISIKGRKFNACKTLNISVLIPSVSTLKFHITTKRNNCLACGRGHQMLEMTRKLINCRVWGLCASKIVVLGITLDSLSEVPPRGARGVSRSTEVSPAGRSNTVFRQEPILDSDGVYQV